MGAIKTMTKMMVFGTGMFALGGFYVGVLFVCHDAVLNLARVML